MSKEINLPPFYVGQKVVYLDVVNGLSLYAPVLRKGDVAIVVGTFFEKAWKISDKKGWFIEVEAHPTYHYCADDFAPVQEQNFQSISLEKVLEKETPLISVN